MAGTVPLSVKWGKEEISFDFVVAGGVKGLKTELEEKTRVPADRMKLMAKSKGMNARELEGHSCSFCVGVPHTSFSFICMNRALEGRFEG